MLSELNKENDVSSRALTGLEEQLFHQILLAGMKANGVGHAIRELADTPMLHQHQPASFRSDAARFSGGGHSFITMRIRVDSPSWGAREKGETRTWRVEAVVHHSLNDVLSVWIREDNDEVSTGVVFFGYRPPISGATGR